MAVKFLGADGTSLVSSVGVALTSSVASPASLSLFTARTLKVYSVPLVSFFTVCVVSAPSVSAHLALSTLYWYFVILEPPLSSGASHVNVTCLSPAVAVKFLGAVGLSKAFVL